MAYKPGDRVRTTVDAPAAWEDAYSAPAGTLGTITNHFPPKHGMSHGYGVRLDDDPTGLSAHYDASELAPEEGT
ncbi:hypothetical protein NE857_21435 [Nocardiopsis exhalans]|uniref:Hypervirulence associated protein TUDOR domain-containing protein n=1 Tax=Nocardiopsis exhalans TaxID=163604 RepID=A0ABY5D1M3_9ACTN|nr:hypothetical protein [Nocardiopsis exhalans]USY17880.1 hypothetical protein NE857_21435 [Nocardiopsis exhalans]